MTSARFLLSSCYDQNCWRSPWRFFSGVGLAAIYARKMIKRNLGQAFKMEKKYTTIPDTGMIMYSILCITLVKIP